MLRQDGARFRLVAGLHRIEAIRILGRETIPARIAAVETDDEARLMEVMENLGRYELIALDRCRHLWELKQVWERLRAKTLVEVLTEEGGKSFSTSPDAGGKGFPTGEDAEVFGFARSVAKEIGLSKQAINMAVKIWEGLYAPLRPRLAGTDLARKQTELKALSELPRPTQVKVLDLILGAEHPDIQNVAGALAFLERGVEITPVERQFRAVNTAFQKLGDDAMDMVVANSADRVIASLKRLGRL